VSRSPGIVGWNAQVDLIGESIDGQPGQ